MTEELVGALKDSGSIVLSKNNEFILNENAATGSIPNSLSSLLTSKVDRLSPTQQIILKVASVIGNFPIFQESFIYF